MVLDHHYYVAIYLAGQLTLNYSSSQQKDYICTVFIIMLHAIQSPKKLMLSDSNHMQ